MKTSPFLISSVFAMSIIAIVMAAPAQAQSQSSGNKNYIAPAVSFLNGATGIGATSKIGVADNISVRPFVSFGSIQGASFNIFGAAVTYDLNSGRKSGGIAPYGGIGAGVASASANGESASVSGYYFEVGADYDVSENIVINANYRFGNSGYFNVGAGYRF